MSESQPDSVKTRSKARKKQPAELWVVFDTNAFWLGAPHRFAKDETQKLIREKSGHSDLTIRWYAPEIVVQEREYQMTGKAVELLSSLAKLETLLGHGLNITEEIIRERVPIAARKERDALGIQVAKLDTTRVDWSRLVRDAVLRLPP